MSVSDNFKIWRRIKEGARHFCKHIIQTNDVPDLLCPLPSVVYVFNVTSHPFLFVRVGNAQSFATSCQNPKIRWETGKGSCLYFESGITLFDSYIEMLCPYTVALMSQPCPSSWILRLLMTLSGTRFWEVDLQQSTSCWAAGRWREMWECASAQGV